MRLVAAAGLVFWVAACGAPQIDESTLPRTSRVGIVPLLGHELEFRKIVGWDFFPDKFKRVDVTDWQMNAFVAASLRDDLKDRFEMVSMDRGKHDLSDGFTEVFFEEVFEPERVADQIKAIADEYKLDALIVATTYMAKVSSWDYKGYGILYRKLWRLEPKLQSFATPELYFVDCKSLKVIARWRAVSFQIVEGLPRHPSYGRYSADERVKLKLWVGKAIAASLREIVREMDLSAVR